VGVWNAQNGQFIYPTPKTVIKSGDIVIILSHNAAIKDVEKLFSFSINLF
jgi:Trk K+ transport system NAD-binding subunit